MAGGAYRHLAERRAQQCLAAAALRLGLLLLALRHVEVQQTVARCVELEPALLPLGRPAFALLDQTPCVRTDGAAEDSEARIFRQ